MNLLSILSEYYMINHARLNRHTIKIMKSVIESKELDFEELGHYEVIEKTHMIIKSMVANKQEWCIEFLLDIIHELLT